MKTPFCKATMMDEGFKDHLKAFLEEGPDIYLPNLSIDCVIFAYQEGKLKVLLPQFWELDLSVLPGGFVGKAEDIDTAAHRILEERTGLGDIFLQQFKVFGRAERAFESEMIAVLNRLEIPIEQATWMMQRFVTIGYYALIRAEEAALSPGPFSQNLIWADANELPQMALDHAEIIQSARALLMSEISHQPVAKSLLPPNFTIPELQGLYETILDRSIDRGNFRKKVLKANILEKLDRQKTGGAHRAPQLYRFHPDHYPESLHEKVKMGF
ncbi:MAG: NUDIX domain-containing protein [Bacteroidota bacterium]